MPDYVNFVKTTGIDAPELRLGQGFYSLPVDPQALNRD